MGLVVVMCFCTSCTRKFPLNRRIPFMLYNDDSTVAAKRFEQILTAIESKDKDSLKAMFSEQALGESKTIDEDIDYLFSFFQGDVVSCEQEGGPITSLRIDYGSKTKEMKSWFVIKTTAQKYLAFILDYTENTVYPENEGIYALRIIKAENEATEFGYWQDMNIPGIYHPKVLTE